MMNSNLDRLYELLPTIYRQRDTEQGYPLKALLRVITEQTNVVEDDIGRLYDNWFIETCEDWAVPYIGDLVGYRPVHEAGEPGDPDTPGALARNKILIPRREVANTIRYRRRKGTLWLLEELGRDVAGWPTRAVEFFMLLGWTQNINHLHIEGARARTVDVRKGEWLDVLDGPFDQSAHTVDVRRVNSRDTPGRYNITSVGLFVWRLKPYSICQAPPHRHKSRCYHFSMLGQNVPLYTKPEQEPAPTHIARELNLPVPIGRRAFERNKELYYGKNKSLAVWAEWAGYKHDEPIPVEAIIPADLTGWQYQSEKNTIAVDPELGRIAFPKNQPHSKVRVMYHYGFGDDLGGGEYQRSLSRPQNAVLYRVGVGERFERLVDALKKWHEEQKPNAVIEITDSGVYPLTDLDAYDDAIAMNVDQNHSLQIRAVKGTRPVIRLSDVLVELGELLRVTLAPGARFSLDGLLIAGGVVSIESRSPQKAKNTSQAVCPAEVSIRHCTLVPGAALDHECNPIHPEGLSLKLENLRGRVNIEHSIVGSIQVNEDEVNADPIPIAITDSIVDATGPAGEALALGSTSTSPIAHALLTIKRCTVFGIVEVHAIELAENCIFNDCLNVARRQLGCMRFCYVPEVCRTPRRYNCQPDLAEKLIEERLQQEAKAKNPLVEPTKTEIDAAKARESERVQPQYNSTRYGTPTYCQLTDNCAEEIKRGADDESEMGVFHNLFQPQREANLRARLDEYTPAGMYAGIIYAS